MQTSGEDPYGPNSRNGRSDRGSSGYDGPGGAQLPPELDPRGKRRARQDQRAAGRPAPPVAGRDQRPVGRPPSAAAGGAPRSRRSGSNVFTGTLLGVKLLVAGLSLAILLGSGYAWATYRNFTADITRVNAIPGDSSVAKKNIDGTDQNILIVGNDDRDSATDAELAQLGTTRDGGTYNTDTMMLLHVPANGSQASVISFPRDSYVAIPGHGMNKLNAAYPDGVADGKGNKAIGAQLLVTTIENLTQLKIDHFVQVDLLGFYRISNAIGGVTVCLTQAMVPATTIGQTGTGFDSGYEPDGKFVKSYSGINLKKGDNIIKGTQALAFVRQRHGLPHGDLDRIKRQQYFLSAVFRKVSSAGTLLNPFKLQNLLKAITSSLTMDQTLNPIKLGQQMQNLTAGNVRFATIPTAGDNPNSPVGDVVLVDNAAMPAFVNSLIGSDAATKLKQTKAAVPSSVTVTVYNDANANGLEKTNAAALAKLGFKTVVPPATTDVLAKTTIRYSTGQEAAVKAVQAAVPGAVIEKVTGLTGVRLLLGNNGIQVKSLMPAKTTPTAPTSTAPTTAGVTTAADAGCIY